MPKIISIDTKLSKMRKNLRDQPSWVTKAIRIYEKMDQRDRELVTGLIFASIKEDIKLGLAGEDTEVFFKEIDKMYEASEEAVKKCFFCDEDADSGLCLRHLTEIMALVDKAKPGGLLTQKGENLMEKLMEELNGK
jgi:hypothetical protein